MDAKDYLLKVNKICEDFEKGSGCDKCPLHKVGCGLPKENSKIKSAYLV
jgi:hypothetical protein